MPCKKSCEKLWNNYLTKYGDYRERLQLIRNDQQCFKHLHKPLSIVDNNRKLKKKCDPLLPLECCDLSIMKNNRLFPLNKTDLDKLEKLIEDENFPDNIFPVNIKTRSSLDNLHRSTSLLNSIIQNDEGLSMKLSIQKSEPGTTTHDSTKNPYAQLIERLRQAENSNIKTDRSTINTNTNLHIQNFLSFLSTLDDTNTLDENTLIALFSIDNHLSSSIYIPKNIQQFKIIPKNKQKLNEIQVDNKSKELNSNDQDNELNFKLFNTYTIKAFKDFLIHRNKSPRLPKLFNDIDHYHRK